MSERISLTVSVIVCVVSIPTIVQGAQDRYQTHSASPAAESSGRNGGAHGLENDLGRAADLDLGRYAKKPTTHSVRWALAVDCVTATRP